MGLRISVVTPSFNQAAFLEATLRSVLEQNYNDVEYIVMDGGSTDGSTEVLRRYADRLSYVQSQPDGGQTMAIIDGFRRATGDILAWINSDDEYEPGAIREAVEHFECNPRHEFIYGDATWIDAGGRQLSRRREIPFYRWVWLRSFNYIPQPSAFWTRDLYERVSGLDPSFNLAMDTDLFARFSAVTEPVHVPRSWSRMRSHGDQKNTRLRSQSNEEDQLIRARFGVTSGPRWPIEHAIARSARIAYKATHGKYWG